MRRVIFLIVLLFFCLTILFTYPLILKINNSISGFFSSDEPYAALWNFWWVKYSWVNHLDYHNMDMVAVPFGYTYGFSSGYPIFEFINKWLVILTNNIFAYNFWVLASFFLAGIIVYYLVYYLTHNHLSAIFSGIIYAFCPYHFARAWQHLTLSQIQWMPLFILSLFFFNKRRDFKALLFVLLSFILLISFDVHYTYFMGITYLLFIVYLIFTRKLKLKDSKIFFILSLAIIIIGVLLILPTPTAKVASDILFHKKELSASVYSVKRPFEDLFSQSARPLSYFLPAIVHPILGSFTQGFLGSSLYGDSLTEHMLYLGWIPLVLSFMAFRIWRKSKKKGLANEKQLSKEDNFNIGFFISLAITAWFFSQPPWWQIGSFRIYMPSFFAYKIIPLLRAYCRFGVLVMLAIAVLAGYGFKFVLEGFKMQSIKKTIIAILLCAGVIFEFWNYPPLKIIVLSKISSVYSWLKGQDGDFAIAEYPLDNDTANEIYKFYQTKHEKKIINGAIPGTTANKFAQIIVNLSSPYTAGVLRGMGVKYALVHKQAYLDTGLKEYVEEMSRIPNNSGLNLVTRFDEVDVYEVIASPIKPKESNLTQ